METLLIDGMHGDLAKKLRIFGFDTTYLRSARDDLVIEVAVTQSRMLITADKSLHARALKKGLESMLLTPTTTDDESFARVLCRIGVKRCSASPVVSRCPICNGELVCERSKVREVVIDSEAKRKQIYKCRVCGKEYWEGTHWKSLRGFSMRVNSILARLVRTKEQEYIRGLQPQHQPARRRRRHSSC